MIVKSSSWDTEVITQQYCWLGLQLLKIVFGASAASLALFLHKIGLVLKQALLS